MFIKEKDILHIKSVLDDEGLAACARELALDATAVARAKLPQIVNAKKRISAAYEAICAKMREGAPIPASAETIIENHYTVEKCLNAMADFPKTYSRKKQTVIRTGSRKGTVRAFAVSRALLESRMYSIDRSALASFINSFQTVSPLTDSEIAVLPDMIKLICLIQLEGQYVSASETLRDFAKAEELYEKLKDAVSSARSVLFLSSAASEMNCTGITRLYTLLSENDEFALIAMLRKELSRLGKDIFTEAAGDRERLKIESEITVNLVNTIRFADSLNTEKLLEEFSVLGSILNKDEVYSLSDTATKRGYARECERIAARLYISPTAVANQALKLAGDKHIGSVLLSDEGKKALIKSLGGKAGYKTENEKLTEYIALNIFITGVITALCACSGFFEALAAVIPAFVIANAVVIGLYNSHSTPRMIPRLDADKVDLPKTVVAVSALITDEKSLRSVMEKVETHYLSSRLENAYFAVLSDFPDSKEEKEPDELLELLDLAKKLTLELNRKYKDKDEDIFYFFHRRRVFCENDGVYMGKERKRGAIMSFFEYILASDEKRREIAKEYMLITGIIPHCPYAVVLDSDTVMPKGTLSEMIGAITHPQNRARVENGVVKEGYGILIPRMETLAGSKTEFMRTQSGFCGITPYTSLVCDFYNDTFNSAIFGGKGIIDIAAFTECMSGRIDDNTVLSHDMLESLFVRAGLLSDVVLYDNEPKTLISWWKRQHRWIRGDWQLLPYLFAKKGTRKYTSALSKWKIFDNLRRSVSPYFIFSAIWLSVFLGWKLYAFIAIIAVFFGCIEETVRALIAGITGEHISRKELTLKWQKGLFDFMSLPYAAMRTFDAVVRSLYRVIFSHKKMLEWQTAAQSEQKSKKGAFSYYTMMWISPLAGLRFLVLPLLGYSGSVVLGILFLYAPFALYLMDAEQKPSELPHDIREYFEKLSYDIWGFFKEESSEENGFTPPDNIQISPAMPAVLNTSPTNIGMGIMASCCAYDLGFIEKDELAGRLSASCDYIASLEKWNGHLYNWYDIRTREKLLPAYVSTVDSGNLCACMLYASQMLSELDLCPECADTFKRLAYETDFKALYDDSKNLFYIGFDERSCSLTRAWYDLLASEARLTYMVACALGQISQKGWFSLSRVLVKSSDSRALVSWSGTMFEYLMPVIFTGRVSDTLIDETVKAAVEEQIKSGKEKNHPWGISESGYYAFDRSMYYQYRAFGARALGLSPIYSDEDVIAPYASVLAAMIDQRSAYNNLLELERLSARGKYGYYEALDFTAQRVKTGRVFEIVESFMAHHEGMSICSLCNVLCENSVQKRFERIPEIKTVLIFNQEKLPSSAVTLKKYERAIIGNDDIQSRVQNKEQVYTSAGKYPRGVFLSNGRFTYMQTDSGISYLKYKDIFLSRFRRDSIRSQSGLSLYIKSDNGCFSLCGADGSECETVFKHELHKSEVEIKTQDFSAKTESIVLQNEDALCVKITVANHSPQEKRFELGAFCEMSLAGYEEDIAHPAFVKLTTDAKLEDNIIFFRRRKTQKRADLFVYCAFSSGKTKFCADGLIFPGRHKTYLEAMKEDMHTDMRIKSPIEPVLCARNEFTLSGGESRELLFIMGASETEQKAHEDAKSCISCDFTQKSELAFAMEMSSLHFMGISGGKAQLFNRIITRLALNIQSKQGVFTPPQLTRESLYRFSISGTRPLVLVEISSPTQYRLLKTLLRLLRYAVQKGEGFELAIIGRYKLSYRCDVKSYITELVSSFSPSLPVRADEYIHIIDGFDITSDEYSLLQNFATVIIDPDRTLDRQFSDEKPRKTRKLSSPIAAAKTPKEKHALGGFNDSGEYEITLYSDENTPLPWSNIMVNPQNETMGSLITESGGGYTWRSNCHESRLTPWYNDVLKDPQGEMILICNDSGDVRSVFHSRIQGEGAVKVQYGYGYSVFENPSALCNARLTVFTDTRAPQKISLLKLTNNTGEEKRLFVYYMVDWDCKEKGAVSYFKNGTVYIRSAASKDCFYATVKNADSVRYSGDRYGVLRFCENLDDVNSESFSSLKCTVTLSPYESRELILIIGMANEKLVRGYISSVNVQTAHDRLHKIKTAWAEKLGAIEVKTPDNEFNTMVNGRLLYQVYASRLMTRTGYYQSGGAFGFRDQLQDVLALLYTDPERAKGQIILSSSMQFKEGDVLHWWHAPSIGVRTLITDDRLFLPFVCAEYARVTGDYDIYDIKTPFLADKKIPEGCGEIYFEAEHSKEEATIYEHCMLAIKSIAKYGRHGLPLMGKSDWNDGMDNVGDDGGESVFLAFFMMKVISSMLKITHMRKDGEGMIQLVEIKKHLQQAVDESAWDGSWYRRAYYGDGTPLGSSENDSCMIDLLTQAWAVLSDFDRQTEKCKAALSSVQKLLKDDSAGMIKLLTGPFKNSNDEHFAGYIESYVEGVRENGGQYTHAAVWYLMALCIAGEDELAMEVMRMLNPIVRGADTNKYMTEPYVVAADVYSCEGAQGRGGWTWYTGSASWLYVAAVRYILGLVKEGDRLKIEPHNTWERYSLSYTYGSTVYNIEVVRDETDSITLDSRPVTDIILTDDGKTHEVRVYIGKQKCCGKNMNIETEG